MPQNGPNSPQSTTMFNKKMPFFQKNTVFPLFLRQIRGTEGVVKRNNTLSLLPLPFTPPQIYLIDTKPNIPNTNYGIPLGGMPLVFLSPKNPNLLHYS
jgi:hypothetical protein